MALVVHDWMIERDPSPELPPEVPSANSLSIPDEAYAASTAYAMDPTLPLGPTDWDEVDRANAARVDELNNEFIDLRDGILHDGDDAFFNRTGRDAILAAPQVHARLEAARQETLGRAANGVQRQGLGETLGKHKIVEHFDIGDHVGRQSVEWQKSINRGRLDRLNRQAGRDHADPRMIEALANASEGSARDHARASGLRPDSPEAQAAVDIARSSVFRHAIESALAKGAHSAAIKLRDRARDKLVPGDAELLDKIIEDAREMEIGKDYVAKIAPLSLTMNTSIEDLDKQEAEATAKNNADWKDNDTQRATNQHLIDVQFGEAKRQVDEGKAKLTQTIHDWVTAPGSNGRLRTARPPLTTWAKLTPEEQTGVDTILKMNAREPAANDAQKEAQGGRGATHSTEPPPGSPEFEAARRLLDILMSDRVGVARVEPPTGSQEFEAARRQLNDLPLGRGTVAIVEPPSPGAIHDTRTPPKNVVLDDSRAKPVTLPDGSTIPNRFSRTGYLLGPENDLAAVAEEGRRIGENYLRIKGKGDPLSIGAAIDYLLVELGLNLGHAGTYDYQREGSIFTKYIHYPQYRDVANVNVGLLCQQAGLSLEMTLLVSGLFARLWSSNRTWDIWHYFLDLRTEEFIRLGYELGESGKFDIPPSK